MRGFSHYRTSTCFLESGEQGGDALDGVDMWASHRSADTHSDYICEWTCLHFAKHALLVTRTLPVVLVLVLVLVPVIAGECGCSSWLSS